MERTSEEWQETIKEMLSGINRYNPDVIESLEQYVQFQVDNSTYDFEPNLVLMKLYQFRPNRSNVDMAVQVMLKALVVLPKPDFVLLRCVLSQTLCNPHNSNFSFQLKKLADPKIESILSLYSLLECCRFKDFWAELATNEDIAELFSGFEEPIRDYICSVIDFSYQTIDYSRLAEYLGGTMEEASLSDLITKSGWTKKDGSAAVQIRVQETTIKSKKILAKIEFDSVAGIIASAAAR